MFFSTSVYSITKGQKILLASLVKNLLVKPNHHLFTFVNTFFKHLYFFDHFIHDWEYLVLDFSEVFFGDEFPDFISDFVDGVFVGFRLGHAFDFGWVSGLRFHLRPNVCLESIYFLEILNEFLSQCFNLTVNLIWSRFSIVNFI